MNDSPVPVLVISERQDDVEFINRTMRDAGHPVRCTWVADVDSLAEQLGAHEAELIVQFPDHSAAPIRQVSKIRQQAAPMVRWVGMLNADVSPATGFGSITNLRATCAKLTQLSFTDHYGDTFNVILDRSVGEDSLTPQWDGASNKFRVTLTVIKL